MSGIYAKSLPVKEVTTGIDSNWNGVHKPITFEFIRGDITGFTVNNAGDTQINGSDIIDFSELVLGDFIDLIDYSYNGSLYGINSVVRVEVINIISPTSIVVDLPFVAPANCFVNVVKREDWYNEVSIKGFKPNENTESVIAKLRVEAKEQIIIFNVAPFLRSLTLMTDTFDYTSVADSQSLRYMAYLYRLSFNSIWLGGNSTVVTGYDVNNFDNYINGVKQIGELYGNNFADFYLVGDLTKKAFLFNGINEINTAGIIGTLNFYKGYPITFGLIANDLTDYDLKMKIEQYDQNDLLLSTGLLTNSSDGTYRVRRITDGNISNVLTRYFHVQFIYDETLGAGEFEATYKYRYDVIDFCPKNSVYLSWLHPTGARLYYLFQRNNINALITKPNDVYNPYFADIETQNGDVFITGKEVSPSLTVGGVEVIEKYTWLKSLLYATNVLMLTNPSDWLTDGAKWQNVNIPDGSFTLNQATDKTVEFSFNIVLPKINTQSE